MKKIFLLLTLITTIFISNAQPPATYYNTAAGLTGTPLRSALKNIIDGHSVKSYGSLYTHFATMDTITLFGGTKVWDIYSYNATNPSATAYTYVYGSGTCGTYSVEGDCYNREHSWPQSWFGGSTPGPYSDLFHLYPTDGKVNGWRSNYPFGEVNSPSVTTTNGSLLGPSVTPGYAGTVFEPLDEFKGDLARGFFYMSTRYYGEDAAWVANGTATNKCEILPWQINLLMQWHFQDSVSAKEIHRNNRIFAIQGNRNPFIDNPQYAMDIWSSLITNTKQVSLSNANFAIYPNPATDVVTLDNIEKNSRIVVTNVLGELIFDQTLSTNENLQILVSEWNAGIYTINVVSDKVARKRTFVKQ